MSLDVRLSEPDASGGLCKCGNLCPCHRTEIYWANITHNLNKMAQEVGIYQHCWHPDEIGITKAAQLIEPLTTAIALMKSDPERFKHFDASNGWGLYENFVPWLERYLAACQEHPGADVEASC